MIVQTEECNYSIRKGIVMTETSDKKYRVVTIDVRGEDDESVVAKEIEQAAEDGYEFVSLSYFGFDGGRGYTNWATYGVIVFKRMW